MICPENSAMRLRFQMPVAEIIGPDWSSCVQVICLRSSHKILTKLPCQPAQWWTSQFFVRLSSAQAHVLHLTLKPQTQTLYATSHVHEQKHQYFVESLSLSYNCFFLPFFLQISSSPCSPLELKLLTSWQRLCRSSVDK